MSHGDVGRFSEWAPHYDRHWMQRLLFEPVQRKVVDLAARQVPDPAMILDVGCGTGRLLRTASERFPGAALKGVDPAVGMVERARAVSDGRFDVELGTAEQLPFAAGEFDLVFSTMTFHHWADQRQGVAEIARVLKPAGRWVLADFIATGLMRYIRALLRIKRMPERTELEAMLRSAGLRVVAEDGVQSRISVLAIGRS